MTAQTGAERDAMERASAFVLHHGDCLEVMRAMDADSVDAIVTDPPYGLAFMGKDWDHGLPGIPFWQEALRVAKPGAHLLAFGGTRTFHRLAVAIEDGGWEIRDTVMWVYGSGFPKSLDVSKAIDKMAGAEREVVGVKTEPNGRNRLNEACGVTENKTWGAGQSGFTESVEKRLLTAPATDAARQWSGWGTALKPAWEPVIVARKPIQGTVAENVLRYGTGAINVDGCRIKINKDTEPRKKWDEPSGKKIYTGETWNNHIQIRSIGKNKTIGELYDSGRWPANLIHDGSEDVVGLFPMTTSGIGNKNIRNRDDRNAYGNGLGKGNGDGIGGDSGSAARFFYCAKASRTDRDEGLEWMPERWRNEIYGNGFNIATKCDPTMGHTPESVDARPKVRNHHPTVKPTALMRYLCRLVTPPGGVVLDPFAGSGSTGKAALLEGFRFVGIEREAEYLEIARRRIEHASRQPSLTLEALA